jgi:hypothetical protein
MGPYEFLDVAIPTFSHNPAPTRLWTTNTNGGRNNTGNDPRRQWRYAIFHIGDGIDGADGGKDCRDNNRSSVQDIAVFDAWETSSNKKRLKKRQLLRESSTKSSAKSGGNIHVSDSLHGPWMPLLDHDLGHCNNPAPWVHPANGTLFVLCNYGGHTSELFKSEHGDVSGPYELVTKFYPKKSNFNSNATAETAYEDPFLCTDPRGNFHVIYHAYQKTGPSDDCQSTLVSAHAYSRDGFEWHTALTPPFESRIDVVAPLEPEAGFVRREGDRKTTAATKTKKVTLASWERPKLFFGGAPGLITHMVEGVYRSPACDATPYKPWCVHCKYRHWDFTLISALDVS